MYISPEALKYLITDTPLKGKGTCRYCDGVPDYILAWKLTFTGFCNMKNFIVQVQLNLTISLMEDMIADV